MKDIFTACEKHSVLRMYHFLPQEQKNRKNSISSDLTTNYIHSSINLRKKHSVFFTRLWEKIQTDLQTYIKNDLILI